MTRDAIEEWEFGIEHYRLPGELHRGPMTEQAAREWVQGWIDDGGRADVWRLVRRPLGSWRYAL